MGIGELISKFLKSDDDKVKTKKNNSVRKQDTVEHIDSPHSEDINYLKSEKIVSKDKKSYSDNQIKNDQKKNTDENKYNIMNKLTDAKILEVLSNVYDPEIPIDIVNLGLIYDIVINDDIVDIKMTMTAPGCPASAQITAEAKYLIEELEDVGKANIEIVWDPPWDPSRMSEEAKQSMGYI